MNTQANLRKQAIQAAKDGNWQAAIEVNQAILDQNSQDAHALNRLGIAYLQMGEKKQAVTHFEQSLAIDKTNIIAKKNLQRLKANTVTTPSFTKQLFIEEPGKTRTVDLCRLASKEILESLAIGQECQLKPKKRCVSVEAQGVNIGVLPDDISFRLNKFISTGNVYSCFIYSVSPIKCSVYLKEESKSEQNQDYHSFPINKNAQLPNHEFTEESIIEEYIPVEHLDHTADMETNLETIEEESDEDVIRPEEDK